MRVIFTLGGSVSRKSINLSTNHVIHGKVLNHSMYYMARKVMMYLITSVPIRLALGIKPHFIFQSGQEHWFRPQNSWSSICGCWGEHWYCLTLSLRKTRIAEGLNTDYLWDNRFKLSCIFVSVCQN